MGDSPIFYGGNENEIKTRKINITTICFQKERLESAHEYGGETDVIVLGSSERPRLSPEGIKIHLGGGG
ncbi:MAG: hypothetical protein WCF03_14790, partial [Nitrososphaeraceae archaeon]